MVIVPSPGSIWDYPYLNQVTSMMGLVYGTRSKPEQDLFPSKIRIPEIHVISPLHLPFHLFNISMRSLRDLRSIIFSCERCMCFFFYFLLSCFSSHQSFWQKISTILEKKRPRNDITIIYLPSSQELSRDLFIFFFFSPPLLHSFPPPFSRIGNSIHLKKQRMSLIRVLGNAVRTFLCTIEYDCEIIDNLE